MLSCLDFKVELTRGFIEQENFTKAVSFGDLIFEKHVSIDEKNFDGEKML